ncbi:MAG TPA: Ig-like domain-containing protein [Mobilitalea sp.]|nr:Ig-like domain-containing protein [Mobilitalea sp.]
MKMSHGKKFALIMAVVLMVPFLWSQSNAVAEAATPAFAESNVEIIGEGETYQLEINDKVAGSTYKWTSSKSSVAKVSSKGLVTTVGKGTSTIKCKITYPTAKTKTLSTKVKVVVPATEVRINNAVEVNGAHIMLLGQSFNFNRDIVPAKSSDKTYWSIGGGDESCIKVDNNTSGQITATKVGKVILTASTVKSFSAEDIKSSIVDDSIIIEVVGPTAAVYSAEIIGSNEMKVVFDSPMDRGTLIVADDKLSDNITIAMKTNIKKVSANDPGALTASLSTDLKTLIIKSANMFKGEYSINFTSLIRTAAGVAIEPFSKVISFVDSMPPVIIASEADDTGMIVTMRFNEAIDFTDLKVSNATLVPTYGHTTTADQGTFAILNNRQNYIASEDKKSLTINLSKIASTDFGKQFTVILTGIKDLSGNYPLNYTMSANLTTNIDKKPNAVLINVARTGYRTITATFTKAIEHGGMAILSNGSNMMGVVDVNDNKKVIYTLSENDALLSGYQTISIGHWRSFNIIETDTSSNTMIPRNISFDVDRANPVLMTSKFDAATNILTLTYNKEVTLTANTGVFNSRLVTITDEIRSGTLINYAKLASTDNKVIQLQMSNMSDLGNYTFKIDQSFVLDNFHNYSLTRDLTISNTGGESSELPPPYPIMQSSTNLSQITVDFTYMVDVISAETVSNYSIPGVIISSAVVTDNNKSSGATVTLTVLEGSIDVTVDRPITISGIIGYNGSYSAMSPFTTTILLKENRKPVYTNIVYDSTRNVVQINFNEQILGSMRVKVTPIGYTYPAYEPVVTIADKSVTITLSGIPQNNTALKIDILENKITDLDGNKATAMTGPFTVPVYY